MGSEKERLPPADEYVGFLELRAPRPHGFDLPTLQGDTRLVALLDEILESRFAVLGNQAGGGGLGLGHRSIVMGARASRVQSHHEGDQALSDHRPTAGESLRGHQRYRELPQLPPLVHAREDRVAHGA